MSVVQFLSSDDSSALKARASSKESSDLILSINLTTFSRMGIVFMSKIWVEHSVNFAIGLGTVGLPKCLFESLSPSSRFDGRAQS